MHTIFDKQFKQNIPKRHFVHKAHIGLSLILPILFFINLYLGDRLLVTFFAFCSIISFITLAVCLKLHNVTVSEYTTKFNKEKQDHDMKNAFNFGSYQYK